jgi:hypothetical protein
MILLPQGLKALKQVAKQVGLDLRGAYLNLDGGFDSMHNRKCIFNAGLIPNIPENRRNRKRPKRGRKRLLESIVYVIIWSAKISATSPLTRNRANSARVRFTISLDLETIMDLRLKRPNQWRWRQ